MVLAAPRSGRASGGQHPSAERSTGSGGPPGGRSGSRRPGTGSWAGWFQCSSLATSDLPDKGLGEPALLKVSWSTSTYSLGSLALWDWEASTALGACRPAMLGALGLTQHSGGVDGSKGTGSGVLTGRSGGPSGVCAEAGLGTGPGSLWSPALPLAGRRGEGQCGLGALPQRRLWPWGLTPPASGLLGDTGPALSPAAVTWPSRASLPISDVLEVLSDIDEMSRRRPEILGFFSVSKLGARGARQPSGRRRAVPGDGAPRV